MKWFPKITYLWESEVDTQTIIKRIKLAKKICYSTKIKKDNRFYIKFGGRNIHNLYGKIYENAYGTTITARLDMSKFSKFLFPFCTLAFFGGFILAIVEHETLMALVSLLFVVLFPTMTYLSKYTKAIPHHELELMDSIAEIEYQKCVE